MAMMRLTQLLNTSGKTIISWAKRAFIGLMVVGAMTASMIDITIPLSFGAGEAKTQVQDIINDILPCMLPLVSFGIVYWLLGRKVKPLSIIGGMALVGILGSWIGLF